MKKTVIAMAVAAALPVTAQADITLSGSVSTEFTLGSDLVPAIEAKLSADSSEVLANGMTATASFSVLSEAKQDTIGLTGDGTIGLAGDFGEVKAGSAAKILSEVANSAADKTNDEEADLNGFAYTSTLAGLDLNAAKGQFEETPYDTTENLIKYTTYGVSYDFNGLKVSGQNTKERTASAITKFTAEYAFGDLTVSGSKSTGADTVIKAAYEQTMDDLAVKVSADSADKWNLEATYTMTKGDLAVTAKDDQDAGGATISAKYTSGDLSLEVDSDSKVTVAYDIGNADLSMVRDDTNTKVKYTVSF
jgi:hypothetical protein